jgi:hypothetical protein
MRRFSVVVFSILCCTLASTVCARSVTIQVQNAGAPVVGAKVMVSADEMDAVGQTDAQGKVTITTSSTNVVVTAEKNGFKGTTSGSSSALTINLTGGN